MVTLLKNLRAFVCCAGLLASGCSLFVDVDAKKLGGASGPGVGPGQNCDACDDGIACTQDVCEPDGTCSHLPMHDLCDDGLDCTADTCEPQLGCVSKEHNERCEFCFPGSRCDKVNGAKEFGGCSNVKGRRACVDDDACTTDLCSVADMMCVSTPIDADGDGVPAAQSGMEMCGGTDCDDTRADVFPGAVETCNGRDDDCNGRIDDNCLPSPDHCAGAAPVELNSQGVGIIEGSLGEVGPDFDVACGSVGTRDAVHTIFIEQDGVVDVTLSTDAASSEVVLALGRTCDDVGFRLGCAKPMRGGGRTRLALHRYDTAVHGKQLFVLVDGKNKPDKGAYRVHVKVAPAAPDVCVAAVFDHLECGTVVGFMGGGGGRLAGTCQDPLLGRFATESLLRVAPPQLGGQLDVRVRSDDFSPSLYALSGCGLWDAELGCNNPLNEGPEAKLSLASPGNQQPLVLVVDSASAAGQSYTLTCE